jgi:hypothetical protein
LRPILCYVFKAISDCCPGCPEDGERSAQWWPPLFVHQSFGEDERIAGFTSLEIRVVFHNPMLYAHVCLCGSPASAELTSHVLDRLALGLPADWSQSAEAFAAAVAATPALPIEITSAPTIMSYPSPAGSGSCVVRAWSLSSPAARAYHRRLECLSWWLIDGQFCRLMHSALACGRVRHSVAIYGQLLLFCDQSMRSKAWRSRKRGA